MQGFSLNLSNTHPTVNDPLAGHTPVLEKRDWIAGLEKGLAVIEAFDDQHPRLTASQAGARCGLTRTAARRYLLTLQHMGYVASDGKLFWLTPRVLRLGQSYLDAARLPRLLQHRLHKPQQARRGLHIPSSPQGRCGPPNREDPARKRRVFLYVPQTRVQPEAEADQKTRNRRTRRRIGGIAQTRGSSPACSRGRCTSGTMMISAAASRTSSST